MNGNGLEQSSGGSFSRSEHELLRTSRSHLEMEDAEDKEEEGTVSLPLEVQIQIKDSVSTSIYICEVCQKDKRDYNTLGDHRKHVHKLPWRQERLGPYVSVLVLILQSHPIIHLSFTGRNLVLWFASWKTTCSQGDVQTNLHLWSLPQGLQECSELGISQEKVT